MGVGKSTVYFQNPWGPRRYGLANERLGIQGGSKSLSAGEETLKVS